MQELYIARATDKILRRKTLYLVSWLGKGFRLYLFLQRSFDFHPPRKQYPSTSGYSGRTNLVEVRVPVIDFHIVWGYVSVNLL